MELHWSVLNLQDLSGPQLLIKYWTENSNTRELKTNKQTNKKVKLYPQTICNMVCEKNTTGWCNLPVYWPLASAVQESIEKPRQFIFYIVWQLITFPGLIPAKWLAEKYCSWIQELGIISALLWLRIHFKVITERSKINVHFSCGIDFKINIET